MMSANDGNFRAVDQYVAIEGRIFNVNAAETFGSLLAKLGYHIKRYECLLPEYRRIENQLIAHKLCSTVFTNALGNLIDRFYFLKEELENNPSLGAEYAVEKLGVMLPELCSMFEKFKAEDKTL